MRKGIIIWIGILAVIVLIAVFAIPQEPQVENQEPNSACSHGLSCKDLLKESLDCSECGVQRPVLHSFKALDCSRSQCTFCGVVQKHEEVSHIKFEQISCTWRRCTSCGTVEKLEQTEHLQWCAGLDHCLSCGQDMTAEKAKDPSKHFGEWVQISACKSVYKCSMCAMDLGEVRENHTEGSAKLLDSLTCKVAFVCVKCHETYKTTQHKTIAVKDSCTVTRRCLFCDYAILRTNATHVWVGMSCFSEGYCEKCGASGEKKQHTWEVEECGESTYCSICGIYGGRVRYPRHEYENKFLRVFDRCTKCGRMQIENSNFDWIARVAEILGVLLVAFGFQYAIRKHKFMRINWLIVIFLWLEENTFFGNINPAVLWKKKLN